MMITAALISLIVCVVCVCVKLLCLYDSCFFLYYNCLYWSVHFSLTAAQPLLGFFGMLQGVIAAVVLLF